MGTEEQVKPWPNKSEGSEPATTSLLAALCAMRQSTILLAVALLALPACRRAGKFKTQAEFGQPIVRAIEDYHKRTGSYPRSLDELPEKFSGWDYRTVSNGLASSYRLRFNMGKDSIEYEPPDWIGNEEGRRTVVLSNR
jgi:hypothetical protein